MKWFAFTSIRKSFQWVINGLFIAFKTLLIYAYSIIRTLCHIAYRIVELLLIIPVIIGLRCLSQLITLPINIPLYILSGKSVQSITNDMTGDLSWQLLVVAFQYIMVVACMGIMFGIVTGFMIGLIHNNLYINDIIYIIDFTKIKENIIRELKSQIKSILKLLNIDFDESRISEQYGKIISLFNTIREKYSNFFNDRINIHIHKGESDEIKDKPILFEKLDKHQNQVPPQRKQEGKNDSIINIPNKKKSHENISPSVPIISKIDTNGGKEKIMKLASSLPSNFFQQEIDMDTDAHINEDKVDIPSYATPPHSPSISSKSNDIYDNSNTTNNISSIDSNMTTDDITQLEDIFDSNTNRDDNDIGPVLQSSTVRTEMTNIDEDIANDNDKIGKHKKNNNDLLNLRRRKISKTNI